MDASPRPCSWFARPAGTAAGVTAGSTSASTTIPTRSLSSSGSAASRGCSWSGQIRPTCVPIDGVLAAELRTRLAAAGWSPDREDAFAARMRAAVAGTSRIGTERTLPAGWDAGWDAALVGWMAVANLEERLAAVGWLDPAVLAELRTATGG